MDNQFSLIFTLVEAGFTDLVMDAARNAGATGGTLLHARGTGNKEIEEKFGIIINSEKEIVLIIVPDNICDNVLKAINEAAGLATPGKGVAFALKCKDVVGLKFD